MRTRTTRDSSTATRSAFGERVRSLRERRGLTLDFLAAEAGLSKTYVWQLEQGVSLPSAESLGRLADALGFTMDELWRGVGRLS